MQRREFLRAAFAAPSLFAAPPAPRPNIVLVMADDMGFSDIGPYGGEIATPTLDTLARNGLRFTQFYNTARCCPTRASLLTGLYPHQAGIGHMMNDYDRPGYRGDLNRTSITIAEVLRSAGYRTAMCGKWHVTPQTADSHNWPLQRGFEKFYGTIAGAGSFWDPNTLTRDNTPIKADRQDFYYTDELGSQAANYIGELAGGEAPFFLYLAFTAPHWPMHAREETIAKYKDRYRAGWDAIRSERHARQKKLGVVDAKWELSPRAPEVPKWEDVPDKEWQIRRMAVYAAMVDHLDQNLAKVVAKLKEKNQLDNTLVFFLADNGGCAEGMAGRREADANPNTSIRPVKTIDGRPVQVGNDPKVMPGPANTYQSYGPEWAHASNTPFRLYKHYVHEGGISSPLIVHWPNGVKGKNNITRQPGHLIDIMATCVDVAGAAYPAEYKGIKITPLEGKSLRPIFEGRQRPGHEAIYWEHEGNQAIRMGDWKLVKRHGSEWELYNLASDRTELHNLSAREAARVESMAANWQSWANRSNVLPWQSWNSGAIQQKQKKKKKS
ncbi:MAG TPA: arylsulfatase [Bryobacteraceae bacterium]|nr:arylsulfatase [Bryobacteraceae bacterium]